MLQNMARLFDTMRKMQRERGHFLNWYDTDTLEPLAPRYVSTVDSGNLAAASITLRQGLLEWKHGTGNRAATADFADILMECGASPGLLRACCAGAPADAEQEAMWFKNVEAEARNVEAAAETEEQRFWTARCALWCQTERGFRNRTNLRN